MKKFYIILLSLLVCLCACAPMGSGQEDTTEDVTVWLNMNTEYPTEELPRGDGHPAKVILLLGQSNATGCSLTSYLKQSVGAEQYAVYESGFDSVRINFCLDDHKYTSGGAFVKTDLMCAAGDGYFGPELGMAEVLAGAFPDETVFILKYSMSGYSLHHHWLCAGERGSIYEACMEFVTTYLQALTDAGYDARVGAVCWMQGESDTTDFKASKYLANQSAFAAYLREDLAAYAEQGGIYFIDAGISNSPYCEPAYPAINEAKVAFAAQSELNLYFSTIDAGYTVHKEPEGDPDWGHYDAESELALGHRFGELIVESYEQRTN
ncbi:MAG: hypothetical protein IKB28_05075 [Clostridia bacterium]|nr:hypothetical protein [Clostridia bacterium]